MSAQLEKPQIDLPAHLGYGDRGAGGAVAPGETLTFMVDQLDLS